MEFRRTAILAASGLLLVLPFLVSAQAAPYSQLVVSTQTAAGVPAPSVAPIVYITATSPTMAGIPNSNSGTISYASAFNNDVRTITFIPGSYSVTVTPPPGYYVSYSAECSGFTPLSGSTRGCLVTLTNVPPTTNPNCPYNWKWNGVTCVSPVVTYQGPTTPTQLSCSPAYQTVGAGQAATFTATGGTGNSYSWTTSDRTTLNTSARYTTVFQTMGTQTVIVSNGVQNATCTVTVGGATGGVTGPVVYPGNTNGGTSVVTSGTPSITSSYVPAGLPNTGFEPQNGAALAFTFVLIIGAGIIAAPYVRKAAAVTLG